MTVSAQHFPSQNGSKTWHIKHKNCVQKTNVSVLGNWISYSKLKIIGARQNGAVGR